MSDLNWFTVEYEGPTVRDGDVVTLLAPGAQLRRVDVSQLRRVCDRCNGTGSIESSRQEDARFSFQDQCPKCSSWGVVNLDGSEVLLAVEPEEER